MFRLQIHFTRLTRRETHPPFHTQNTPNVALQVTGEPGSRGRVARLPPQPENASIFKDQNQLRDERDENSLFCPQPPGHSSQLCGNLMQMELGHLQR